MRNEPQSERFVGQARCMEERRTGNLFFVVRAFVAITPVNRTTIDMGSTRNEYQAQHREQKTNILSYSIQKSVLALVTDTHKS